jgi:hypothetical protein
MLHGNPCGTKYVNTSRNNQHFALICTIPLFYILAPTCFGSSLPSSGSFLAPSELLEIQIEWVVYHVMCGYVTCVPECRGSNGMILIQLIKELTFDMEQENSTQCLQSLPLNCKYIQRH